MTDAKPRREKGTGVTITDQYRAHKAYVADHHPLTGLKRLELRVAEAMRDDGYALAILRGHLRGLGYTERDLVAIERGRAR